MDGALLASKTGNEAGVITKPGGSIMKQFSRVLVAVDSSKPARGAFEYALALSKRHGAELIAVQAVPLNQAFGSHARERYALTAKLRRKADLANVRFQDRVQQGDPAKIILLHAGSLHPDVIVMGTHQRSGFDRFGVGSVAERVAATSSVPVLVVPARRRTSAVPAFRHLAVAVDFSAGSNRAIERALTLASDPGDRITLLHVVPGFAPGVPPHLRRSGLAEYQDQLLRDARRRLQLAVPVKQHTPAAIHTRVLLGDTAAEIGRVVESIGADLLVVGVPKRGIVSRALFGTTAVRLLRTVRVPLLAVPDVQTASADEEGLTLQLAA
jgi:nucleotide-binding universal stress UspA family protein